MRRFVSFAFVMYSLEIKSVSNKALLFISLTDIILDASLSNDLAG